MDSHETITLSEHHYDLCQSAVYRSNSYGIALQKIIEEKTNYLLHQRDFDYSFLADPELKRQWIETVTHAASLVERDIYWHESNVEVVPDFQDEDHQRIRLDDICAACQNREGVEPTQNCKFDNIELPYGFSRE